MSFGANTIDKYAISIIMKLSRDSLLAKNNEEKTDEGNSRIT